MVSYNRCNIIYIYIIVYIYVYNHPEIDRIWDVQTSVPFSDDVLKYKFDLLQGDYRLIYYGYV